ncbi:hypothetical protein [Micromonospora sp. NPDC006431]|uniref:hypothetical protein n=1 Tax=Micromonospora sp. NPDC006431 TaxID=3364235 RepID=UPI00368BBB13
MTTGTPARPAASDSERLLLLTFVLFRLGALAQVAIGLVSAYPTYADPAVHTGLAGSMVVSSLGLIVGAWGSAWRTARR